MTSRGFQVYGVSVNLLGIGLCALVSMSLTDGLLVYSLDDPYIHLAVAENLLAGHSYGINPGEHASPSSSILYPFLLMPLLALGLGTLAPLALSTVGSIGSAWIASGLVWRAYSANGTLANPLEPFLILPFVLICLNLVALPLTGMEHTLHVWASLAVLLGLTQLEDGAKTPLPLIIGVIACPLLRFEGMALALGAIGVLALSGRWRAGAVLLLIIAACLASYAAFMTSLGLPVLPSSVLTKHSASAAMLGDAPVGALDWIVEELKDSVSNSRPILLLIGLILLAFAAIRTQRGSVERRVALGVGVAGIGHLLFGQYGWFSRYEIYIFAIVLLALFFVYRGLLSRPLPKPWLRGAGISGASLLISIPYIATTAETPGASENVYAQQYQLHRFSKEFFDRPVAANDIGYLAYDNPAHLLDLWGLGSEAARKMAADGKRKPQEIRALTDQHGTEYALIYTTWFSEGVPEGWCHIARLTTPQVTSGHRQVSFYLINRAEEQAFRDALARFEPTLPDVSSLQTNPEC